MDLDEVIRRRRMCRNFSDRPVPPGTVDRLLDRAVRAPSAGFSQGWRFLVLEGQQEVGRFWTALADEAWRRNPNLPGLLRAPVVVVPLASPQPYLERYSEPDKMSRGLSEAAAWAVPYWLVDASFATMLLLLGAVDEGLGALFFGRDEAAYQRVRQEFAVPAHWQPLGAVLLGWPATEPGPPGSATRARRPLGEIVHRGGW
ncbi:MAG: nitroreductase family protein [Acidobacteriota bacterium]|nr:nitroreductase family protein [Acidobacteriota bacterium]